MLGIMKSEERCGMDQRDDDLPRFMLGQRRFGLNEIRQRNAVANPGVDALIYHVQAGRVGVVHSGDSDYFDGFREVGERYAVDIALLNLGRTPPQWGSKQYMNYCEVVRAACDLRSKVVIPTHWDM